MEVSNTKKGKRALFDLTNERARCSIWPSDGTNPFSKSGEFNIKFSSPEAELLLVFLDDELKLKMNTSKCFDN
ncbi:hypothetical protein EVAR_53814_1 [Eumeta japonica]|uniref:Uncharacterized protein n=1 Tax=Eumeta variegata TaxID=151549 RepID=A0A4C1YPV7_EUMVA|nr:hypothetical protein EVAR_53814_1 [Eumeta japonica]